MMTTRQLGMTSALLGAVLAGGALAAQQEAPPPDKSAGEGFGVQVESAVKSFELGARDLDEYISEEFARTKEPVHRMSVETRVYSRLHWDKALTGAQIAVDDKRGGIFIKSSGIFILRGVVPDSAAKAKAVALTRDTVGVVGVEDLLTIGSAQENTPKAAETRVTRGVKTAREISEESASIKEPVHRMSVVARIYGRLHWDKALSDAEIEVHAKSGGVFILRGVVPDSAAKAKAVALTRDTVDVVSVEDLLTIGPAQETTTTTETTRDGKTIHQETRREATTPRP